MHAFNPKAVSTRFLALPALSLGFVMTLSKPSIEPIKVLNSSSNPLLTQFIPANPAPATK